MLCGIAWSGRIYACVKKTKKNAKNKLIYVVSASVPVALAGMDVSQVNGNSEDKCCIWE